MSPAKVRLIDLLELLRKAGMSEVAPCDTVVSAVNDELAESMARIKAAGEPPRQGDQAHDDFLELIIYGNKVPAVADFLHQFFRSGAGVISVRIDPLVTDGAMSKVFRYDLEERLQKLLTAYRAGNFIDWNISPVEHIRTSRTWGRISQSSLRHCGALPYGPD